MNNSITKNVTELFLNQTLLQKITTKLTLNVKKQAYCY